MLENNGVFDSDSAMLMQLNAVEVSKEELLDLVSESAALHSEQDSAAGFGLLQIIKKFRNPDKALAVSCRMRALAHVIEKGGLTGWTRSLNSSSPLLTHEAVFAAVAVEPLVKVNNDIGFDKDSLLSRVLSEAEAEGNA